MIIILPTACPKGHGRSSIKTCEGLQPEETRYEDEVQVDSTAWSWTAGGAEDDGKVHLKQRLFVLFVKRSATLRMMSSLSDVPLTGAGTDRGGITTLHRAIWILSWGKRCPCWKA